MIQFFKDKGGITDLFQKLPEPIRMLQNFPISHSLIWNNKMKEGNRLVGISKQFIRPKKENIHKIVMELDKDPVQKKFSFFNRWCVFKKI